MGPSSNLADFPGHNVEADVKREVVAEKMLSAGIILIVGLSLIAWALVNK